MDGGVEDVAVAPDGDDAAEFGLEVGGGAGVGFGEAVDDERGEGVRELGLVAGFFLLDDFVDEVDEVVGFGGGEAVEGGGPEGCDAFGVAAGVGVSWSRVRWGVSLKGLCGMVCEELFVKGKKEGRRTGRR